MASKRAESFTVALDTLRAELRSGVHRPGTRLTAGNIGSRLALSATPVREALSWLAGEGLLDDRRGQGFFVRRLGERDLVHLLRLQLEILLIACGAGRGPPEAREVERLIAAVRDDPTPERAIDSAEQFFRLLAAASSPALARTLHRLQDQLALSRRVEPLVLERQFEELLELLQAARDGRPEALREALEAFHARRIEVVRQTAERIDNISAI